MSISIITEQSELSFVFHSSGMEFAWCVTMELKREAQMLSSSVTRFANLPDANFWQFFHVKNEKLLDDDKVYFLCAANVCASRFCSSSFVYVEENKKNQHSSKAWRRLVTHVLKCKFHAFPKKRSSQMNVEMRRRKKIVCCGWRGQILLLFTAERKAMARLVESRF
jgi:hypothetical protein